MTTSVPDLMHSELVMSTSVPDLMHSELFKSAHLDPFERLRKKVFSYIFSLYPPPLLNWDGGGEIDEIELLYAARISPCSSPILRGAVP